MSEEDEFLQALIEAVGDVLATECPIDRVLDYSTNGGPLSGHLRKLSIELGWLGLVAPETAGGGGLGFAALLPIYRELGRRLAPLPMLAQQLCIEALTASNRVDDPRLAHLASGEVWGAAALPFQTPVAIAADAIDIPYVLDDGSAGLLLLFAEDGDGVLSALLVDIGDAVRTPCRIHDRTRPFVTIRLEAVTLARADRLAVGDAAIHLRDRLIDHVAIALAADAVGGAEHALARTVEYMKTREQFGRAIGSFQALKHRAASMKLRLVAANALLTAAVTERDTGTKPAALASLARARAGDAYVAIAGDCIQLHGGIGYTWENPTHLFLKRAKLNQLMDGGDAWHLDRAAALVLEDAA